MKGGLKTFHPVFKKKPTPCFFFNFVETVYSDLHLSGRSVGPGFKEIQGRPAFGFVANGGGDLTVLVFVLMIIPFFFFNTLVTKFNRFSKLFFFPP